MRSMQRMKAFQVHVYLATLSFAVPYVKFKGFLVPSGVIGKREFGGLCIRLWHLF